MNPRAGIYVAGGDTFLGTALRQRLQAAGFGNLVGAPPDEPDLTDRQQVEDFFRRCRPEYVFVAAGQTGGIQANQRYPADLMRHNLLVGTNVIHQAYCQRVVKLLYLASSCSYPQQAPQPLGVESLLSGPLEPTNEAYALAKLAGWKLCQAYRRQYGVSFVTALPANVFGPHDDFDLASGHVIPALMRRLHEARQRGDQAVTIWGSGRPRREFLFARDFADACLFVMNHYDDDAPINLGGGVEHSIAEIARLLAEVVGYEGRLVFDTDQPDGMPRKALDSQPLLALGWRPQSDFRAALEETYAWRLSAIGHRPIGYRPSATAQQPAAPEPIADSQPPTADSRWPIADSRLLYHSLYRIRRVEEEIARVYPSDGIKSPVHLSLGQEAVSVGVCQALQARDVVFGTYRGHALYLAKGGDLKAMIAELYGKATGCAKGKGGSMHLIAPAAGMMGASAVVGTTIANAVGYAYALKHRRQDAIVASFFGDGATEEGVFAESLNFAALKKLPLLFVCENNQYAIHTHQSRRQATPHICARARAHGLPAERIDNNDVLCLYQRSQEVVARLRAGEGPWFFEVMTYRWHEHVGPGFDFHLGFRGADEARPWRENDQVTRLAALVEPESRRQLELAVEEEIAAAFAFAQASPFPPPAALYTDVFQEAGGSGPWAVKHEEGTLHCQRRGNGD